MQNDKPFGMTIYLKEQDNLHVLKDLLQLLKVSTGRKTPPFFYVEEEHSLLPHLSLCENLQLMGAFDSWKDLPGLLKPEHHPLINLIKKPGIKAQEAQNWERLLVSLLKAFATPAEHLLINVNEEHLDRFMAKTLKEVLLKEGTQRQIFLATSRPSFWLDCAHSLVTRKQFEFKVEKFDESALKGHWKVA